MVLGDGIWEEGRVNQKLKTIDYLHVCLVPQRGHRQVLLSRLNSSAHQRRVLRIDTIKTAKKERLGVHLEKGKVIGKRAGWCKGPETETIWQVPGAEIAEWLKREKQWKRD